MLQIKPQPHAVGNSRMILLEYHSITAENVRPLASACGGGVAIFFLFKMIGSQLPFYSNVRRPLAANIYKIKLHTYVIYPRNN